MALDGDKGAVVFIKRGKRGGGDPAFMRARQGKQAPVVKIRDLLVLGMQRACGYENQRETQADMAQEKILHWNLRRIWRNDSAKAGLVSSKVRHPRRQTGE